MDWLTGKNRKRDKEATTPTSQEETKPYLSENSIEERITDTDLQTYVALPDGIDYNEWIATHTLSFFELVNLMYGTVSEFCQSTGCSSMTGPGSIQYQWVDENKKKCKCTAPQYIDYVMSYSQKCIYDETVFPTKFGNVFPSSFDATVRKIHRLLLHVLAHLYQCHHQEMSLLKLTGYLNTLTYHFLLFNKQFGLIEEKEMEVLDDLFQRLHQLFTAPKEQQQHADDSCRTGSADECSSGGNLRNSPSADSPVIDSASLKTFEENKENLTHGEFKPVTLVT